MGLVIDHKEQTATDSSGWDLAPGCGPVSRPGRAVGLGGCTHFIERSQAQ